MREVQSRGEDIKRIERTITELAQLFNDVGAPSLLRQGRTGLLTRNADGQLALMVEEQDAMIVHIENNAVQANRDVEGA